MQVLFLTVISQFLISKAAADSGTWTNKAGGIWSTPGNWAGGIVADGATNIADFSTLNITANPTITLDSNHTIGALKFADTTSGTNDWTLQASGGSILTLSSNGAPEIYVSNRTANINLVLDGTEGFKKSGAGTLELAATNTYTGTAIVTGGVLIVQNNLALGTASAIIITSNNMLRVDTGISVSNIPATIYYRGNFNGAIQTSSGTATWAGPVILGDDRARLGTATASSTLVVDGAVGDAGNNFGPAIRCFDSSCTVLFNALCTYSGVTEVVVGVLKLGGNERISPKSIVQVGNGSNIDKARFDLAGYNQTFAGLTSIGSTMEALITNSSPSLSILTVSNDTSVTYGASSVNGIIIGNISLVKAGPGTQTLTRANFHTGNTIVSNGTLNISGSGTIGSSTNITVGSGGRFVLEAAAADAIGNTADVILKTGAPNGKFYLTNGAYEVIGRLFFDGTEKAAGTWGSSASSAANKDDAFFEGTGVLAVGMPVSEGSWSVDSGGAWSVAANWTNNTIASGPGKTAYFTNTITGDHIVTQDLSSVCIGSVFFDAPGSYNWSVVSNTIELAGSTPTITVNTNTVTISSVISAPAGIIKTGPGTLILSSTNTSLGSTTINRGLLILTNKENALLPTATVTLGDSANVTNSGIFDVSGLSQSAGSLETTTQTNSNSLATNQILNLSAGKLLNLSIANSNNVVFIKEGTHLVISGGGSINITATNGNILVMGRRDATPDWGLDLSQLGSLTTLVNTVYVGYDKNGSTRKGLLTLAAGANKVTAGSIYVGWGSSAGGVSGQILMGPTNEFHVANIYLGYGKANGTLTFNPGLTNPKLELLGTNGIRANVYMGIFDQVNSGTQPTGNLMITNVDSSISAMLDQMVLGSLEIAANGTTAGGYGNFTFNGGTVDVNTVTLGRNMGSTRGTGRGTLTMNGGLLNVNSNLTLGQGTVTTGSTYGAFIVNGGTANIYTNIEDGGGSSLLTLNGGILDMHGNSIGSAVSIIDTQNFQSGTLMNVAEINGGSNFLKTTSGTLIIAGSNTFSGNVIINDGILNIAATNTINDSKSVLLNTNGVLYLGSGLNETVSKLYFDGVPQSAGTWGKPGSSAANQSARFDGPLTPGILTVLQSDGCYWSRDGNGNWSDPLNWTNGVVATGDVTTATFNNSIAADRTVNQDSNNLIIANIYFGSPAKNWTISGNAINITNSAGTPSITVGANTATVASVISGVQGLTKAGTGTLVLSGANNYTGGTIINAGKLQAGSDNTLPTADTLTISGSSGSIDLSGNSQAIGNLVTTFTNATPADIVTIGGGRALTVNGSAIFGMHSPGMAQGSCRISGGGTLAINNTASNFVVGLSQDPARAYVTNILDMSGLKIFNAAVSNIYVGRSQAAGPADPRNIGQLTLASNNVITAGTSIQVGTTASGAETTGSFIRLGLTNVFNAGKIVVGGGRGSATMSFADGLTDPVLAIRGATGGQSRASLYIGDQSNQSGLNGSGGSPNSEGSFIVTNGTVNAMLDWLVIGNGGVSAGVYGRGTGTFMFGKYGSTVDVNTLVVGRTISNSSATNGGDAVHTGTLTMTGGTFNVNSTFIVANNMDNSAGNTQHVVGVFNLLGGTMTLGTTLTLGTHNSSSPGVASGTLNLSNGTLTVNGDIQQGTTGSGFNISTVTLAGVTLNLTGHRFGGASANYDITTLNIENGTLMNVAEINNGDPLVKTTAGILILTGTNTYSGDTIVNAGILRLSGSSTIISDISSLSINGAGQVYIESGINETVRALFFDGAPQPTGTWGSPGSGAAHEDAHFDGPGILTVQTADGSWAIDGNGNWSISTNWASGIVALGNTVSAYFTNNITANRVINQDYTSLSIANLFLGSPSYSWIVSNNTINLTNARELPKVTVNANTATVASAISGSQALTKAGAGTLVLSGTNVYTGGTFINGGTLAIGADNTLPVDTAVMIGNTSGGAGFDLGNFSQTVTNLLFASSGSGVTNKLLIGSGGILNVNGNVAVGQDLSYTSVSIAGIEGEGSLTVTTNGGRFQVSAGNTVSSSGGVKAFVDMSALATTMINVGSNGVFYVGDTQPINTGDDTSTLILASNSTVIAGTAAIGPGGRGFPQTLKLGTGSTLFRVTTLNIGSMANRDSGQLMFNTANGTLTVRDISGTGRASIKIGVGTVTTGYIATNTLNVNGHILDLLLDTLTIGDEARGGSSIYSFSFDTGTVDTTGLRIGCRPAAGTPNASGATHYYTANIGGGTVIIGTNGIVMGENLNNNTNATIVPTINITNGSISVDGPIYLYKQGSYIASISSYLSISGGTVTVDGDILTSLSVAFPASHTATFTLNGGTLDMLGHDIGGTASSNWIDVLNFQSGRIQNIGQINGGNASLLKTTTGTLFVGGINRYSGATIVSTGKLHIATDGSISSSTGITVEAGAQVIIENTGNALLDNTVLKLNYAAGPGYGNVYLTNGINEIIGALFLNGVQQNVGTWGASGSGAANTNNNYFSGTGILNVLGNQNGSWNMNAGGNWSVAANWTNNMIPMGYGMTAFFTNAITADRTVTQNNTMVYLGNLTFGSPGDYNWTIANNAFNLSNTSAVPVITVNNATATMSSVISGAQGLIKEGAGTLILNGNNTYTGNTVISEGTLLLSGPLSSNNAVIVTNSGTLAGTNILAGSVSVLSGAYLSPAGSSVAGSMTIGNLTLSDGANIRLDYSTNSTFDVVAITNQLNISTGSVCNLCLYNPNGRPEPVTQQFTVMTWSATSPDPDASVTWNVLKPAGGGAEGWASPNVTVDTANNRIVLSFRQSGFPAVDNGTGATDITGTSALLTGNYTATGATASVYIYWGRSDGGTNKSNWENVYTNGVTGPGPASFSTTAETLYHGFLYRYRCYASNAVGECWASFSTNFTVTVPARLIDGMRASIFTGLPGNDTPQILDDSAYIVSQSRVFTGGTSTNLLGMPEVPQWNVIATGEISGYSMFPGFVPGDQFAAAFSGQLIPRITGTHNFSWVCDDRGMMYIDLDNDGIFLAGEGLAVSPVNTGNGSVNLNADQVYNFIFTAREYSGSETINFYVTEPGQPIARVNTILQAGMWKCFGVNTLSNLPATEITTTSATLNATLMAAGEVYNVYAYWGTNNAGTNADNWTTNVLAGSWTNVTAENISKSIPGLAPDTIYYFTFRAVNALTNTWADKVRCFKTYPLTSTYINKMMISFNGYNKEETLTNFPVLVTVGEHLPGFNYYNCQNGGTDIRFMDESSSTEFTYEIEEWNTNGSSHIWVQIPQLTSNSTIWMYWNNTNAVAPPPFTTNGSTWANGYAGVWHLNNTNISGQLPDSSANNSHGVNTATVSGPGQIGNGRLFSGSAYVSIGDIMPPASYTKMAWVCRTNSAVAQNSILCGGKGVSDHIFWLQASSGTTLASGHNGSWYQTQDPVPTPVNTWSLVAVTYDVDMQTLVLYRDGNIVDDSIPAIIPTQNNGNGVYIGAHNAGNQFVGKMDEVSLASLTRSSNWIWACYLNQGYNTSFSTYTPTFGIRNLVISNLTAISATPVATLYGTGQVTTVTLYYGQSDAGTNTTAWKFNKPLGSFSTLSQTNIPVVLSGFRPDTIYYFRFLASSSNSSAWTAQASFKTLTTDWQMYRKLQIRFPGYSRAETLQNFPALVIFNTGITNFQYSTFRPGGTDLRFLNSARSAELNYEIEEWNTNGNSYIWVQVPQLTNNCSIWAYWGNSADILPCTTNGSTWSNYYGSVWHLSDGVNTTYDSVLHHTGTPMSVASIPGMISMAISFNEESALISTTYGQPSVTSYTVSTWIRTTDAETNRMVLNDRGSGSGMSLSLGLRSGGGRPFFGLDSSGILIGLDGNNPINDDSWHYLAGTWNTTYGTMIDSSQFKIYVDGSEAASTLMSSGTTYAPLSGAGGSQIAYHQTWATSLAASLDELRADTTARSSNWIWACYMNQGTNRSSFVQYGEVLQVPWQGTLIRLR